MTTMYAMSLTFNDLDDLLADIAPLAFDGDIGFMSFLAGIPRVLCAGRNRHSPFSKYVIM